MGVEHSFPAGRPKSTERGSIGEHLAPAYFILALSGWPDRHSNLEVFRIDRGTDIGIDFILRISPEEYSEGIPSILIAVQVKATGRSGFGRIKFTEKHVRLIRSFPGPSVLAGIKFCGRKGEIFLRNYMDALTTANNSRIDPEETTYIINRWNSPKDIETARQFIRELCVDYIFKTSDVEADLALLNPHAAYRKIEPTLKWLCGRKYPPEAKLMINRIKIRRANWEGDYKNVCIDLDKQNLPKGICPAYNHYCLHYQKAVVRDEWIRSEKWRKEKTPDHRRRLVEALKILGNTTVAHTVECRKRLYRLGLGILAVLVVYDVLYQNDHKEMEWKKWWDRLIRLGPHLDELKKLGKIYLAFLNEMINDSMPNPKHLLIHHKELNRRPRKRNPEENVIFYLLTSVIYFQRKEFRNAHKYADRGCVICDPIKKPLWLAPVELAKSRAALFSKTR